MRKFDDTNFTWLLNINWYISLLQILQSQVKLEEEKQVALKVKTNMNVNNKKHEISFEDLTAKVLATYLRCGMDADPSLTTLQMLTMTEVQI
jgi:hypothetical protein